MKNSKLFVALLLVFVMTMSSALGCTIFMAGKEATVDGSTMCSQTDDSGSADFRLWIIPRMEGGEGITRDLVVDSHNYGDYGQFPAVKDYGNGYAVATIPQPEETNAYLHSRYSFINDQGLAIGECTNSAPRSLSPILWDKDYLIDAWNLQDLALEQCDTAREACAFMGSLIDQFGFKDASTAPLNSRFPTFARSIIARCIRPTAHCVCSLAWVILNMSRRWNMPRVSVLLLKRMPFIIFGGCLPITNCS